MSFYDRLMSETAKDREAFLAIPIVQHAIRQWRVPQPLHRLPHRSLPPCEAHLPAPCAGRIAYL